MPSLRGSPPACASTPVRAAAVPAALLCGMGLWLTLSLAGCSSAADLNASASAGETGTDSIGGLASTGWPTSDSAGGETTGDPSDGVTGGTDQSGSAGTTGTSEPPMPPPDAPAPVDQYDPKNVPDDNLCAVDQSVSWRLAARDAAAMTSPTLAREAMLGKWPSLMGVAIRPWEFLNYYTFGYSLAPEGQLLTAAQLRAGQDDLGDMFDLQVAVRGPELAEAERPPVHLTLALDNSGSMEGKALELLKSSCHVLAGQLRAGDTIAAVSWNKADPVLLPLTMVTGPNDPKLAKAIDEFTVGGAAELPDALSAGYALAEQAYVPDEINRLILISDGGATATQDDLEEMAKRAGDVAGKTGVHTIGIGVGDPALYRRDLVDAIADAGAGPSIYVGSVPAAETQLGARFLSLVGLTASSLTVHITLPPGLQLEHEEQPSEIEAAEQDHVTAAPTDRSVIHRRLRPCVQDLDLEGAIRVDVEWLDAVTGELKQATGEWKLNVLLSGETKWLDKGAAVLAYAAALNALQYDAGDFGALEEAWARLTAAKAALPDDPELAEIGQVLAVLQEP